MAVYRLNGRMHLHLQNISKSYGSNSHSVTVLQDISFEINGGQFVSLLGPSGCGKTTLLTIIAGFQNATGGKVLLNGKHVEKPGPDRGFVFQDFALFPWMTVKENILFPMQQLKISTKQQQERLKQLVNLAQLNGSENLYPSQISGGMKQRTAVIRALASDPEVLLMDEPFGAVDYQMRHNLQEEFESLWQKKPKPVVMVTHDTEEAVYLSDRILVMSRNRGAIAHDLAIDLPRPRNRMTKAYQEYIAHLTGTLKNLRNPEPQHMHAASLKEAQ
jgi:NitT/TauT family transport system ATP-binding protein